MVNSQSAETKLEQKEENLMKITGMDGRKLSGSFPSRSTQNVFTGTAKGKERKT